MIGSLISSRAARLRLPALALALAAAAALSGVGLSSPERGLLLALEGGGASRGLLVASPSGRRLFTAPFAAAESFLARRGDALFLGMADGSGSASILRMDFKEE